MVVKTTDVTGTADAVAQSIGSRTAREGFQNEKQIALRFNNWRGSRTAQDWLRSMGYELDRILDIEATPITGSYKTDVQVRVTISTGKGSQQDLQNLQVKLVTNKTGSNQIDKRWVNTYQELWNIPKDVSRLLKLFTGELPPDRDRTKHSNRMYVTEFSDVERRCLLNFLTDNRMLILADIVKGRGPFSVEWLLVIQKTGSRWALVNINKALAILDGDIGTTKQGGLKIGNVTIQRKGGDKGADTAKMLQFKINPTLFFK